MRNPKDVFTSSFHYYGMASYLVDPGTADEFLEKFLDGKSKTLSSFSIYISNLLKRWRQNTDYNV